MEGGARGWRSMSIAEVSLFAPEPCALPTDDQSLARLARAGDAAALEALVRRWQVPLVRFLQRRVGSHADAEDLFQETFVRVCQHLGQYDPGRSFKTWLFTIAWRLAANHLRNRRHPLGDEALEAVHDPRTRPADSAEQHDEHEGLWAIARRELSPEHVQMLWLCYVEGFGPREIASVTNKSWIAVKTALHRARRALAPHLSSAGLGPTNSADLQRKDGIP